MAGNRTRRNIKRSGDPQRSEISVTEAITKFLEKGPATNQMIREFLSKNGQEYTKMGINKIFKALIKKQEVEVDESVIPYWYALAKKSKLDFRHRGTLFLSHASSKILRSDSIVVASTFEEFSIDDLVKKAGVYAVYSLLRGWDLTIKQKKKDKLNVLSDWLKGTGSMPFLATHFNLKLKEYLKDSDDIVLHPKTLKLVIPKLMEILREKYPIETQALDEVWKNIDNIYEEDIRIKKQLEDKKKYDDYKKRLEAKRKKKPVKKLPKNQCPRCGFNGTRVIMAGPHKGTKFPKGFSVISRDEFGEDRFCRQCEYSERRSIIKKKTA